MSSSICVGVGGCGRGRGERCSASHHHLTHLFLRALGQKTGASKDMGAERGRANEREREMKKQTREWMKDWKQTDADNKWC